MTATYNDGYHDGMRHAYDDFAVVTDEMVERAARALHDAVTDTKWPDPHGVEWWKHCAKVAVNRCFHHEGRGVMTGQRQDDLTAQMMDVLRLAVDAGCYDAHEWIMRRWSPDASTRKQCSLCGYVEDTQGRRPTVPTKGGWIAHEECVATVPSVDARPEAIASAKEDRA